jgi:hypothetical protein
MARDRIHLQLVVHIPKVPFAISGAGIPRLRVGKNHPQLHEPISAHPEDVLYVTAPGIPSPTALTHKQIAE